MDTQLTALAPEPGQNQDQNQDQNHAQNPDRAARRLLEIEQLAAIGMDLALLVQQQAHRAAAHAASAPATEQTTRAILAPHVQVYARIARAVRQTYALEAKLEEEIRTRGQRDKIDTARKAASFTRHNRLARQDQVRALVESSIEADKGLEDKEYLLHDLHDYFLETDIDFADTTRAIGQIAVEICEELGIVPDCKHWEDETMGYTYRPDINAAKPGPEDPDPDPPDT